NLDTHDGERYRPVAAFAATEEGRAFLRGLEIVPGRGTTAGRALLERRAVHIADITADPEYALPEAVTIMNYRTTLAVPLLREGEPIGVIILARSRVAPFSQRQIALVENFAAQAVIAMENARLLGELRERTRDLEESLEYQTATSDVLKVISRSTFDLQPVLDTMIETAGRLCAADSGNVVRLDNDGYHWVAGFGLSPEYKEWMAARVREGGALGIDRRSIVGRVALEGGIVHVHDAASDPEYAPDVARLGAIRTVLGVPLLRE